MEPSWKELLVLTNGYQILPETIFKLSVKPKRSSGSWGLDNFVPLTLSNYDQQGSKKVLYTRPRRVDIHVGQVTFHCHLTDGQGIKLVVCQLNRN